jgi:hypothetical protein
MIIKWLGSFDPDMLVGVTDNVRIYSPWAETTGWCAG